MIRNAESSRQKAVGREQKAEPAREGANHFFCFLPTAFCLPPSALLPLRLTGRVVSLASAHP